MPGGLSAREKLVQRERAAGSAASLEQAGGSIGHRLLVSAGWTPGQGLGVAADGVLSPVPAFLKKDRRGIGAETVASLTLVAAAPAKEGDILDAVSEAEKARAAQSARDAARQAAEDEASRKRRRRDAQIQRSLYHSFSDAPTLGDAPPPPPMSTSRANPLRFFKHDP